MRRDPRTDVRAKVALFTAVMAACFLFDSLVAYLGLATAALGAALRGRPRSLARLLGPLVPLLVLIFGFAAFMPPPGADPRVLVVFWPAGPALTVGGLAHGAVLVLRVITMVGTTTALLECTPVEQFTALLQAMRAPNAVVFLVVTALRFIPTLRQRATQIQDAQRVRGARLDSGGPVARLKASATVMIPLLTCGIRMSEQLSGAMVSRGYGATKYPTRLVDLTWSWRDLFVTFGAICLVMIAIVF
ncbi:MAG: energy-coupling factor transporter transmembrane component T [Propionibacteriaceae bacterium]|nr:energy-coupling factor transporter transmembrane component T [Propionibacteriaceae bacterium]